MEFFVYLAFSAILGVGVGLTIGTVGKPRTPITPPVALVATVIGVLEFIGLTYLYQH